MQNTKCSRPQLGIRSLSLTATLPPLFKSSSALQIIVAECFRIRLLYFVGGRGLEPPPDFSDQLLRLARLPISPSAQEGIVHYIFQKLSACSAGLGHELKTRLRSFLLSTPARDFLKQKVTLRFSSPTRKQNYLLARAHNIKTAPACCFYIVRPVGLEPTTVSLRGSRSTN